MTEVGKNKNIEEKIKSPLMTIEEIGRKILALDKGYNFILRYNKNPEIEIFKGDFKLIIGYNHALYIKNRTKKEYKTEQEILEFLKEISFK
ncbi:MAG: hypothetical protein QXK80_00485 [Candidatus Pacearchaeota archaeon]